VLRAILLWPALAGAAGPSDQDWLAAQPRPWSLSEAEVTAVLPAFQERFPGFEDRLRALALWRIGTPYGIFKLGEEAEPDPDPIFRLDVSDCTAHVLTSLALAQSSSWDEARANMIELHYKPGEDGARKPDYRRRWHYTADRLASHPSTVNISEELAGDRVATATVTLNIRSDGSENLDLGWSRALEARYIPNDLVTPQLLARLPGIVGVAFVKPAWFGMGLVIGHEGMILDGTDLLHASQEAGRTVRQDFLDYYFTADGPRFGGIMIYRFLPIQ